MEAAPRFTVPPARRMRRANLAPMIDVLFLLVVFFLLAARIETAGAVAVAPAGNGAGWTGPPRVVTVGPDALRLNGVPVADADVAAALAPLVSAASDPVVLRAEGGATLQRLVDVAAALAAAGFGALLLAE